MMKKLLSNNSVLGLFEVSSDLKENISKDYKIIFSFYRIQKNMLTNANFCIKSKIERRSGNQSYPERKI